MAECRCDLRFEAGRLVVLADGCPGRGDLAGRAACRATVVRALAGRTVRGIHARAAGTERVYADRAVALLVAAGRFADRLAGREPDLARLARRDPRTAAARASARSGRVADLAAETGLSLVADSLAGTDGPLGVGAVHTRRPAGEAGDPS